MKRTLSFLLSVLCTLPALTAQSPRTGKDYAVFFYVTDYDKDASGNKLTALPDTKTECENLRNVLRDDYGFECQLVPNATLEQMRTTLAAYNDKKYGPEDQVLFFFSMHGYYDAAADRGYLAPKDAKMQDAYRISWFAYDELGMYMAHLDNRHILLAIDACYSGSFGIRNKSGPGGPDYERESDCFQKIRKAQNSVSRIFYTSGSKNDKTPSKSQFASRWLEALRDGGIDGLLRKRDLETYLRKIESPEPEFGTFRGNEEGGDFIFLRKNACKTVSGQKLPDVYDKPQINQKIQRVLNEKSGAQLIEIIENEMKENNLPRDYCISVKSEMGDSESSNLASEIADFLIENKFNVCGRGGSFTGSPRGQGVDCFFSIDRINVNVWNQ